MNKKLISVILICAFLLASCPIFAMTDEPSFEYNALRAFDIADPDLTASNQPVSRGEFVCMAVRMSGIDANLYSSYPVGFPFSDVRASDSDFAYIRAAYEMGLISGNGDGTFGGKDYISIQQATKILLTLLGYSEKAEATGGYPYGYAGIANSIDLYDGINTSDTSAVMNVQEACTLIMNALESTFSTVSSIGEYTEYTESDKMYISQMHDIYKVSGVVEQNEYSSLYGKSELSENEIEINNITYKTAGTNATEFLGYYVHCYFREKGGSREIVFIGKADDENKTLHLTTNDLNPDLTSLSAISYTTADNQEKKAKIASDTILIRNGNMTTLTLGDLCPSNGEITLVSNDGDNVYDVALVYDYRTIVAEVISASSGSISDALGGKSIILDKNDNSCKYSIELSGKEIDISELMPDDVISYYESTGDITLKKLIVSRNPVSGKIDSVSTEKAVVDQKEYYVSKNFISSIHPGDMGTFVTDKFGKIVYGELTDEISVYGFVTGITKSGLDGVILRIFTEKDRWVELGIRTKTKLNGTAKSEDEIYSYFSDAQNLCQLISYKVDANGKISSITTAVDCSEDNTAAEAALENDEFRLSGKAENAIYRKYLASFVNQFSVSNDAMIFFVPENAKNQDEFYISGAGNLKQNYTYNKVYAYNANKTRVTDLIVVFTKGNSVDNSENVSEFMVVDRVSRTLINGEDFPCIYGTYGSHGETCVYVADDSVIRNAGNLNQGDTLQLAFNTKGQVSDISKIYDISKGTFQKSLINGSLYSNATIASGIVTSVDTVNMRFTLDYGEDTDALFGLDTYLEVIIVYDISDKEVYTISPADLTPDDRIVVGCRQYQAQSLVVFRD